MNLPEFFRNDLLGPAGQVFSGVHGGDELVQRGGPRRELSLVVLYEGIDACCSSLGGGLTQVSLLEAAFTSLVSAVPLCQP
ncbi:hypothetical protein ACFYT7_15100 [Streptomyces sp. NPDC004041]|uniref:hypothetical protein n=1 Tax=unclassified Streptomyces TaxID=2593676 RepID=UPI001C0D4500|nr:hypothetical protein [Streptomyces sp. YPW6]QWQ44795.1 hypothetical protein KME66_30280 [Streptomyces sp. YPW6]